IGAIGRWAVTALVLTSVAMLAGMEVGGNGVDIFALYTLAALVNVIGLAWSAGVAMRFRTLQAAPLMQLPVFLSLFFAPVFVPVELLAGWLQTIAHLNPVTLMLAAGRSLIAGQPAHIAGAFSAALALIALFSVWATRGLRRAEAAGGG
ncbi:MAG TPA: ABC transporter permease, partial [Actinomycetota bacterium]|nr:ABC transporter permease [Actinomycetota bacterium]